MNVYRTAAEVTPEVISEWKSKYPHVERLEIHVGGEDDSETAVFFVRKPSVMEMNAITKIASSKKSSSQSEAADMIRKKLVLGGDMKYIAPDYNDADVFIALQEAIGELIGQKKAISTRL